MSVDWNVVEGVVFDIDGTLYDQTKVRRYMLGDLFRYYIVRPWRGDELLLLRNFRLVREKLADEEVHGVGAKQFQETLRRTRFLNSSRCNAEKVIDEWFLERPLRYLRKCRFQGVKEFIELLTECDYKVGFLSDYPTEQKLRALELEGYPCVSGIDKDVDIFKPNTKGLIRLAEKMGINVRQSILIGDRYERDGQCAERVGMRFLLKSEESKGEHYFDSYWGLVDELQSQTGEERGPQ